MHANLAAATILRCRWQGLHIVRLSLRIALGGHLMVGLEPYFHASRTPANAELVERAVEVARAAGRPVAGRDEALEVLHCPRRD